MFDRIPGTLEVAQACLAAKGGSISKALDAIAWTYNAHVAGPWRDEWLSNVQASVRDYGAFLYDTYDDHPHDASFDDMKPMYHDEFVRSVAASFHGAGDEMTPPDPVVLANHLLAALRMARQVQERFGEHFAAAADTTRDALCELLITQSVSKDLALEAIERALQTGESVAEAVAYMDGQL